MAFERVAGHFPVVLLELDQALRQPHRVLVEHVVVDHAVADQQVAAQVFRVFDRRAALVGLRVQLRRVEDVGRVLVVVAGPVGHRAQRGAGLEHVGFAEQRHERHEAAVAAAVDTHVFGVALVLGDHVLHAVHVVLQLGVAHAAVDRRAPVAAVTFRSAVVHVQHDETVLHQQLVEHLLAEIRRPARVHVLQVAGAVHEHHHRVLAALFQGFGAVELGPDVAGAVAGRHLHDLRRQPLARGEIGAAGVGELAGVTAGHRLNRQLRRHVRLRPAQQQLRSVRRQREILDAVERGHFPHFAAGAGHRAHLVVTRPFAVADEIGGDAIGRPLRRGNFPAAGGQAVGALARHHGVEVGKAGFFAQVPQRAAARQPAEVVEAPVDPGWVGQPVRGHQLAAGQVDGGDPAVLVVHRARHQRHVAAVVAPQHAVNAHRAVALERVLAGGLAHFGQRVAADAGQAGKRQLAMAAVGQVHQHQLLALRRVAADAHAHVLDFFVTGLGHVLGHLAGAAGFVVLGFGDHQQPAAVG